MVTARKPSCIRPARPAAWERTIPYLQASPDPLAKAMNSLLGEIASRPLKQARELLAEVIRRGVSYVRQVDSLPDDADSASAAGAPVAAAPDARAAVTAAIGRLNEAIQSADTAPSEIDDEGMQHLLRARAELVRALASQADRKLELREATLRVQRDMMDPDVELQPWLRVRAMQAHTLELRWRFGVDDVGGYTPGAFYVKGAHALDRIGVDQAVPK